MCGYLISHIPYFISHIHSASQFSVSMEIRLDTLLQIANYKAKLVSLSDSTISHMVRMKTGIMHAADNWIFSCGSRYIISPGGDKVGQAADIPPNLSRHNERRPHQLRAAHRHTLATLLLIRIKVANSHCAKCFFCLKRV